MAAFSFKSLIPEFCQLSAFFDGNVQSCQGMVIDPSQGVSAVIVTVLLVLFVVFVAYSTVKYFQSRWSIRFYVKLIADMSQEELVQKQVEIRDQAKSKNKYLGRLWREFDESLVPNKSIDGKPRLSNTLDSAHFFNSHSLARGLTENRLLAAVPGLLTAIGVIGTFMGLQMGLAGIDLSSDDVSTLKQGIENMIRGAKIAFLTSLWGISLSVIFNLFEKSLERSARSKIGKLQNEIDFLYPRINAEQSLVDIADASKESKLTLQGLAEEIGTRMQESLVQVGESISTGMKESLREILNPALEKMALDAHSGSEKALDSMLNRFMDGFGQVGADQRALMEQSSKEVQLAVGQLGSQMGSFIDQLDKRSQDVEEKNKLQRQHMEEMFNTFEAQGAERRQKMASQFESMMSDIVSGVNEQLDGNRQRDHERMQAFKVQLHQTQNHQKTLLNNFTETISNQLMKQQEVDRQRNEQSDQQMEAMNVSHQKLSDQIASMLDFQQKTHSQLYAELSKLKDGFEEVSVANLELVDGLKLSSERMQVSSQNINNLGDKLVAASSNMSSAIGRAMTSANEVNERSGQAIGQLESILEQYKNFSNEMNTTAQMLQLATEHADNGFNAVDRHLQTFQKAMESQVEDMQKSMQQLMSNFADQVRAQMVERIQVWTDETSKYTSVMSKAINTIADVVDDIDAKLGVN